MGGQVESFSKLKLKSEGIVKTKGVLSVKIKS